MNSPNTYRVCCSIPLLVLLTGCFGGKPQTVRSEVRQRSETALTRGVRAEQKGDGVEAERFLTQSLSLSTSIEDNPARVTALINLARLYRLRHELDKAGASIGQALDITGVDRRLTGEAAYEKALVELAAGRLETALEWSQRAIAEEPGNSLGGRLNLAARIHVLSGKADEAGKLAQRALAENRSAGQAEEEANSLRIMGMAARSNQDHGRGIQFLQDALQIDKRIGKSGKVAVDLAELGETARSAGDLKGAAAYLLRASEVNRAGGRLRLTAENQEALASIHEAAGDGELAVRARETARKLRSQDAAQGQGTPPATIRPSSRP